MAKTLQEILKEAGLTDAQITAATADAAVGHVFMGMVTKAEQEKAEALRLKTEAEEKDAKVQKFWNETATPQINKAYSDQASAEATAAFYKTQAEEAKKMGFIAADAPNGPPKKVDANTNDVPGSPGFTKEYLDTTATRTLEGFYAATDLSNEHFALFGQPLVGFQTLAAEAKARNLPVRAYWEQKFEVGKKRQELDAAKQKAHDDKVGEERIAAYKKQLAEDGGSNPDRRSPVTSQFSKFKKSETGGQDRLAWAKKDRNEVRQNLRDEAVKSESVQ